MVTMFKSVCINFRMNFIQYILFFLCFFTSETNAQSTFKVLFLGNSYTGVNNLPQLVHDVALSAGDTLIFDSNTPGGYRLVDHAVDATSQSKIMTGGWDYVAIQGQSQEPVTSTYQFNAGGTALCNQIKQYNSCAVVIPYMTWGRKNGDINNCPFYPVMCTYQGMDTTLRNEYIKLTKIVNGEVSPVSIVWNYIRQNFPAIDLYQSDESHPSAAGSYAAACCFYTTIFKKDPTLISYDYVLSSADAAIIRDAVKTQVFDNLFLYDLKTPPFSDFTYQTIPGLNTVNFYLYNQGIIQNYYWDFGDGDTASTNNPTHSYLADGIYNVTVTTSTCDLQGLHTSTSDTLIQFCPHTPTIYTNHPWLCNYDTLWTQPATSYQWYYDGVAIPENNQFVPDYMRYGGWGYSVRTEINGCTELSSPYSEVPQWSGYYFDAIGNPCLGDTVAFVVLHINGFLSGSENILWYKNDTLLSSMTNEDTLLIFTEGNFECKVIDPNSNCYLDTTSIMLSFDCNSSPVEANPENIYWKVFPNPSSGMITIRFSNFSADEMIDIYSVNGALVRSLKLSSAEMQVSLDDLPSGLYCLRLKGKEGPVVKLVKQ